MSLRNGVQLPALAPGENLVVGSELWWRQCPVGSDFWDEDTDTPSNMMFYWNSHDAGQLSGARQRDSTAEEAFRHRTQMEGKTSHGTWAVPAYIGSKINAQFIDDSANLPASPAAPPGHTYLDVRHVPSGKSRADKDVREGIRARLLLQARRLGRQHPTA
jgi:hypothetical protein